MKVSANLLVEKCACAEQVKQFRALFGSRLVTVTRRLCVSHAHTFNWDWAASNLLSAPAWKAYNEANAPAFATACAIGIADQVGEVEVA